jgi:hypothetical protein
MILTNRAIQNLFFSGKIQNRKKKERKLKKKTRIHI